MDYEGYIVLWATETRADGTAPIEAVQVEACSNATEAVGMAQLLSGVALDENDRILADYTPQR